MGMTDAWLSSCGCVFVQELCFLHFSSPSLPHAFHHPDKCVLPTTCQVISFGPTWIAFSLLQTSLFLGSNVVLTSSVPPACNDSELLPVYFFSGEGHVVAVCLVYTSRLSGAIQIALHIALQCMYASTV